MDDQRVQEAQANGPVDRLAAVGLLIAILLLVASVVVAGATSPPKPGFSALDAAGVGCVSRRCWYLVRFMFPG